MAASAALAVFSIRPAAASCRPRCAIGRAISQSGPAKTFLRYANLEHAFDFDRGVERQHGDADGGAGMPSLVAEDFNDQIRSAVHHLWPVEKIRHRRDKPAEPHDARDAVEIADRGLDLRQQVDRAGARRALALFDADPAAKLSGCRPVCRLPRGRAGRRRSGDCRSARCPHNWQSGRTGSAGLFRAAASFCSIVLAIAISRACLPLPFLHSSTSGDVQAARLRCGSNVFMVIGGHQDSKCQTKADCDHQFLLPRWLLRCCRFRRHSARPMLRR